MIFRAGGCLLDVVDWQATPDDAVNPGAAVFAMFVPTADPGGSSLIMHMPTSPNENPVIELVFVFDPPTDAALVSIQLGSEPLAPCTAREVRTVRALPIDGLEGPIWYGVTDDNQQVVA